MAEILIKNVRLVSLNQKWMSADNPYGEIENAYLVIGDDGKIGDYGALCDLPDDALFGEVYDGEGACLTPALLDCHTHLVYGGNRSNEFEARLQGVRYEEIARGGGGIQATVRATRSLSFEALYQESLPRFKAFLASGVATLEIKSGYGLDLQNERKMLQVAQKLGEDFGVTVRKTYLAAHALPKEFLGEPDLYIDKVCEWLPILYSEGLVDAVDGFCESIAFSVAQMERVFACATDLGLPVKLHAEQLSNQNGSALVARYRGLSCDHIEHLTVENVVKMAETKKTCAVLLPSAFYFLRDTKVPPIEALRAHGVPMAVSTDCNPGTSPNTSLLLSMNMACVLFSLTPLEALLGTTRYAAQALGLQDIKGQIAKGFDADLCLWAIERPADLAYQVGLNPLRAMWVKGRCLQLNS